MALSQCFFVVAFFLMTFLSMDEALKITPRGEDMPPTLLKRLQFLGEREIDLPTLLELYEMEKRQAMPYSGGIFGR